MIPNYLVWDYGSIHKVRTPGCGRDRRKRTGEGVGAKTYTYALVCVVGRESTFHSSHLIQLHI